MSMASVIDDEAVAQFVSFTSSTAERAQQYLQLTDGNVQQAINIFFTNDGNDPAGSTPSTQQQTSQPPPIPPTETRSSNRGQGYEDENGIVHIDSDTEYPEDVTPQVTRHQTQRSGTARSRPDIQTPLSSALATDVPVNALDEDEVLARRLQEEFYSAGGLGGEVDPDGVRAPIGRTTETLVGPDSLDTTNEQIRAAVQEQMRARQRIRPRGKCLQNLKSTVLIINQSGPAFSIKQLLAQSGTTQMPVPALTVTDLHVPQREHQRHQRNLICSLKCIDRPSK